MAKKPTPKKSKPVEPQTPMVEEPAHKNDVTPLDWFAGQGLMGLLANPDYDPDEDTCEALATLAYQLGKAMMKVKLSIKQ